LIAEEVKGNVYEDDVANMINYAKKIDEIISTQKTKLVKYYREHPKEIESLTTKVKNSKTDLNTTITDKTNAADEKQLLVIVGSCLGAALLLAVVAGVVGVWWYRRRANTQGDELTKMKENEEASKEDETKTAQAPQRSKMAGKSNPAFAEENEFNRHHARDRSPEAGVPRREYSPEVRAPRQEYSSEVRTPRRNYSPEVRAPRREYSPEVRAPRHGYSEYRSSYYDYEDRSDSPEPKSFYQDKPSYHDKLSRQDKPKALPKPQGYMAKQAAPLPKVLQVQNRFGHVQPTKHQFINPVNERREFRGPYGPDDI